MDSCSRTRDLTLSCTEVPVSVSKDKPLVNMQKGCQMKRFGIFQDGPGEIGDTRDEMISSGMSILIRRQNC